MPAPTSHDLRDWSQAIVRMYEVAPSRRRSTARCARPSDFAGLVRELVAERRAAPGRRPDHRPGRPTELTEDEVVAAVVLLLNAGHEASVNVFGNGLVAMLARGLRARRADVALTRRGDAALRLRAAALRAHRDRRTSQVGGVVVEDGQKIAALLGAANRDPAVFDEPDEFDVDRDPNPHLAFGVGVHFCLGAPLARMELAESLTALFDARSPTWRWPASRRAGARSCCGATAAVPVRGSMRERTWPRRTTPSR